jgi:hypothetical protein
VEVEGSEARRLVAVTCVGVEGDGGSTTSDGRWLTVVGEETLCFLAWEKKWVGEKAWWRRHGPDKR